MAVLCRSLHRLVADAECTVMDLYIRIHKCEYSRSFLNIRIRACDANIFANANIDFFL